MWRKVVQTIRLCTFLAVPIRSKASQQRRRALNAHAEVQRTALPSEVGPTTNFLKAQAVLCFLDGPAADSAENQLMPKLVKFRQAFAFPGELNSAIAFNSAIVKLWFIGPRSGSASPVMSPTWKTG